MTKYTFLDEATVSATSKPDWVETRIPILVDDKSLASLAHAPELIIKGGSNVEVIALRTIVVEALMHAGMTKMVGD